MRQNQPYGTMWDTLFAEVYKDAPYHWTPIGNMQHLQAAQTSELQAFFNKYYIPGNAVLVIAGKMDVEQTKADEALDDMLISSHFGKSCLPLADLHQGCGVYRNEQEAAQRSTTPRR